MEVKKDARDEAEFHRKILEQNKHLVGRHLANLGCEPFPVEEFLARILALEKKRDAIELSTIRILKKLGISRASKEGTSATEEERVSAAMAELDLSAEANGGGESVPSENLELPKEDSNGAVIGDEKK